MSELVLLEKSKENKDIAEYAIQHEMFNIATSRIYYSLFQKIIYILPEGQYELIKSQKGDSHKNTINLFFLLNKQDKCAKVKLVRDMSILRAMRNKADYHAENITKDLFERDVKSRAQRLEEEINNLI